MPLSKPELESLRADLERAMERRHDYVEDTITMVSDAYYEEVKGLLDEVNEAIRDIDSNDTATVAAVRKDILDSADASEAVWQRFDKRLDGIIEHIDDYFSRIGTAPKIDRAVVETLKGVWPTGGQAGSGIAGDLYDLSQHHRRGLANAVTRNVLGGLPRRNMVNELEELTGRTRWQAKQLAHDSSMAFARTVNAKKAEAAGFEYFEYMGGIVDGTRPFCRKHLEKVYSREEIDQLDNEQTGQGTAFIRGGGYNCLHDWGPVERDWFDDEEWEEIRGSQQEGSGPERAEVQRAKSSGEFSDEEIEVIDTVARMKDEGLVDDLKKVHESEAPAEFDFEGKPVLYEPSLPAQGFTLMGEGGFVVGAKAFESDEELMRTLLHESHRLQFSKSQTTGVDANVARDETRDAASFSERAQRVAFSDQAEVD